ncbi:MAG: queuosine precursor transporter [Bacteroidetes bacterium]|nr:queuosine precursor transporter [Bacteroidota bacterium]
MDKKNKLFLTLGFFFVTNALIAEFIGVKIFSLESTFGYQPVRWNILGFELSFELTAGVILWPVVFIMTDLINEYYGKKGVRRLSYLTVIMLVYAFAMAFMAIGTTPAEWWVNSKAGSGLQNFDIAYTQVFGQGLGIIIGSLIAFIIGQIIDAFIFQKLKKKTGSNKVWLRATGSTLVSQLIDSFVVLYIAFGVWGNWPMKQILAICIMNYIYKVTMAFVLIPVLYLVHGIIDRYLGKELSTTMIAEATEI